MTLASAVPETSLGPQNFKGSCDPDHAPFKVVCQA